MTATTQPDVGSAVDPTAPEPTAAQPTASIGVLLEDLANPFSAAVLRAVEDVARVRGAAVLSGSLDEDPDRERLLVEAFRARHVDGLILAPAGADHSYLRPLHAAGLPVVFVDRPPGQIEVDAVVSDNRAGAATAVTHLIQHGHRRIAYLGDYVSIATARERFAGYCEALEAAGITRDNALVRHDLHSTAQAMAGTVGLLGSRHPPTALFTSQNLVTIGAIRALRRFGLTQRVALVGLDDIPQGDLLDPGITVVAQDPAGIGTRAAELLFRRVAGDAAAPETHVVRTRLIRRGSGEIRPDG